MSFFLGFDDHVKVSGLSLALVSTLRRIGVEPTVKYDSPNTLEVLKSKPVIVICNHPYELDVLPVVAALPSRKDLKVFASVNYQEVGPNTANYIIPAYIRHEEVKSTKLTTRLGSLLRFQRVPPKEESHKKNIESIVQAALALDEGSLLFFSPEGPMGIKGGWRAGLGYLLTQVKNAKSTYLVMANASGVTALDHLRIIPGIRSFFPKITVRYSKTFLLNEIIENHKEPVSLVKALREDYYLWISGK